MDRLTAISVEVQSRGLSLENLLALSEDVRYLHEHPPRTQVGPDKWEEYQIPAYCKKQDLAILLDKVRVVRNNLFHGGKWSSFNVADGRDMKLISGALCVLDGILNCHEEWKSKMPLV